MSEAAASAHADHGAHEPAGFWSHYVFSTDHKMIGRQFLFLGLFMLIIGGTLAMLIRWQLAWPETEVPGLGWVPEPTMYEGIIPPSTYNMLFTMHATIMIFFVVMPVMVGGFGNFLIPIMIGAKDMAFPLLNMLSFWVGAVAGVIMVASFFVIGGAASGGWTSYTPLSAEAVYTGVDWGIHLWVLSLFVLAFSSLMGSINYITTVINMRAPGMTYFRMPLSIWSLFITALLLLLALPVLTAALGMLFFDRVFDTNFFLPAGGMPLLWQHLFWFFGHPEVYVLVLPAMGVTSDVLSVFARKPIFGYRAMVYSMCAIAFLSWVVWGHHMFQSGMDPVLGTAFTLTTMLIAVPSAIKTFNWLGTLWGSSIRFTTPMWFALGFVSLFTIGGLSGIFMASTPVDIFIHDTYYIVAHLHYVLFGGSIMGLFAGIYYWFPKMTGRFLNEFWGKIHFWLFFLGMNITFFPMHYAGLNGMPRRINTYNSEFGWDLMNLISSAGYIVLFAGALLFLIIFIQSVRNGKPSGHDPWDAPTLEWSISSPPPAYNFAEIPQVEGRDPYWIVKRKAEAEGHPLTEPEAHVDPSTIHMPSPSYWPLVIAFGIAWIGGGLLIEFPWPYIKFPISFVGGIIAFLGVIGWANEPAAAESHQ
jgi:cytochrome c oxidase subunit 1